MYLYITRSDDNGQYVPSFAYEVKNAKLNGMIPEGIMFDIVHMDGEHERMILNGRKPYGPMTLENLRNIQEFQFRDEYPATNVIDKTEFREIVGVGALLNERGHFVREKK